MTTLESSQLEAIAAGDQEAFADWLAGAELRLRESLASFAHVVDVEAVMQESLLRVWLIAPRFEPDGRPKGLLRLAIRVARNLALDEARRRRISARTIESLAFVAERDDVPDPPDPDESRHLRQALERCTEELPPRPKQVFDAQMRSPGKAEQEIAASLHMKRNTFYQHLRRARAALEACLKRHGIGLEFTS